MIADIPQDGLLDASDAEIAAALQASPPPPTDWNALLRLADQIGTQANPVCQVRGKSPSAAVADNGGAQALLIHDEDDECLVTSDGIRHRL